MAEEDQDKPVKRPEKPKEREPIAYCVRKDIHVAGRVGSIHVVAHKPIRDKILIAQLRAANVTLEPIYE